MLRKYALGILIGAFPLFSQAFDVASVKPSPAGERQALTIQPGGRFVAHSFTLQALIAVAWRRMPFQISGGDGWVGNDRWSIEAKADEVSTVPSWAPPFLPEVIAVRVRALLEDRFALETHREMRDIKAYIMTVEKGGPKLVVADAASDPKAVGMAAGPGIINAHAVTMDQLLTYLNKIMDLPVVDKTGITGTYDFKLRFAPESSRPLAEPAPTGDPSIFAALQEQLGLTLRQAKEPVGVLVIDSARKPADN